MNRSITINDGILRRFWSKVDKADGGCWEWIGAKNVKGYGEFWISNSPHFRAHKISYIVHFGDVPSGMFVCHKCDNPSCVNPDHLFLGTAQENVDDMKRKNRWTQGKLHYGEAHPQHGTNHHSNKLDETQVIEIFQLGKTKQSPYSELAARFGVSPGLIGNIVKGRRWKWLTQKLG